MSIKCHAAPGKCHQALLVIFRVHFHNQRNVLADFRQFFVIIQIFAQALWHLILWHIGRGIQNQADSQIRQFTVCRLCVFRMGFFPMSGIIFKSQTPADGIFRRIKLHRKCHFPAGLCVLIGERGFLKRSVSVD